MSKVISAILALFTISLAFFFDFVATKMQIFIDKYANAVPYVLPLVFFNLMIVFLCFLQAWLVLIRFERSIILSVFLILATGWIAFLLPLILVTRGFDAVARASGMNFMQQVYFPMIKAGPRSFLSFSAMFIFGIGVINLIRKNKPQLHE